MDRSFNETQRFRTTVTQFTKWFIPILALFSLFVALVCPFLLWIVQEHCLYSSVQTSHYRSKTLITTPRLLHIDPRGKLSKSSSPMLADYYSTNSSTIEQTYQTPPTAMSSIITMV